MILGEVAGAPDGLADALGGDAEIHDGGALRVAWRPEVTAHRDDRLLVLVDGFLLGALADPRALARAWRSDGPAVTDALRGAFTVVIWDERAQRGIVACDHASSRVCFVHADGPRLTFTTHLPAIMRRLPSVPAADPGVVVPWITPRYLQGRRTMAAGVKRLGGATVLEIDGEGWRRRRYWAPRSAPRIDVPREDRPALARAALERAIGDRLPPDGPVGVILSGGLDSSIVAAIANELAPGRVRAYSTLFPDWPHADESARIDLTTAHLGIPSTRATIAPQGALRLALEYLRASGVVPGGPGLLVERPLLERAAADGVRVILDGQGGDEVFGASPYLPADCLRAGDLRGLGRLMTHLPDTGRRRPSRAALRSLLLDFGLKPALGRRLPRRRRTTSDLPVPEWLSPAAREVLDEVHDPWPWLRDDEPRSWAYQAYLVTLSREGSGLGEYTWARSAGLGLQSRTPLFDVELTDLMLRLPPDSAWGRINRPLARAAVAGLLPDGVRLARRKANISPFYFDVVTGPDLLVIRDLLLDPHARVREWVVGPAFEREVRRPVTRQDRDWLAWITIVWRLVTAECWLRWREDPAWVDAVLAREDLPHVEATLATV